MRGTDKKLRKGERLNQSGYLLTVVLKPRVDIRNGFGLVKDITDEDRIIYIIKKHGIV